MTEEKKQPTAESAAKPEPAPDSEPKRRRSRGSLRSKVRWAKRIIIVVLIILLILLLLNWKYCNRGSGSGGLKEADGSQTDSMSMQTASSKAGKAQRPNCRLRVDKKGVSFKGKTLSVADAVKACRGAKRAELSVTGDATFGIVKKLRQALRGAGITPIRRPPPGK